MANTIQVTIDLETGEMVNDLKKMEKNAKKSGKKIGKGLEKGTKSFSESLSALKGPMLALGATLAATFAGRKIIQAAQAQEDAVNNLAASLRSIGEASRQTELEQYAAELQKITVFGDEAIISQLAFAQAMGANADQSKEILSAATDMSAALNIDLNAAVRNISKTLGGFAGELGEVIPELKDLTAEQLKSGLGVELLAKKYAGFAQSEIKTFSGAIAQLENSFGDLLEKMGDVIIKNPAIIKGIKSTKDGINELSKSIFKIGQTIVEYVVAPLELLFNVGTLVFDTMNTGVATVVAAVGQLGGALASIIEMVAGESSLTTGMKDFADTSAQVMIDMANKSKESLSNIFDFEFSDSADQFLESLDMQMQGANDIMDKNTKKMGKTAKKAGFKMQNAISSGISNGVQQMVTAMMQGEDALSAFGKAILGVLGDLAIQMGTFFIAQGIAALAMKWMDPTGSIAAGIGLIALGTLLKGAMGGGGSPSADTSGGGVATTTSASTGAATATATPEDFEDNKQAVVINVEGTVLDPQAVGLQIADVLNEAGFGSGAITA